MKNTEKITKEDVELVNDVLLYASWASNMMLGKVKRGVEIMDAWHRIRNHIVYDEKK